MFSLVVGLFDNVSVLDVYIEDEFCYEFWGMYVDVVWNFCLKFDIICLMDGMVMYKMNKFYLYLSDDEGWRIEIFGLLEFIEVSNFVYVYR